MSTIIDKKGNVSFFGKPSWANFLDWLITLCLGGIIVLTTLHLGGVRPDTQVVLLPLYGLLLGLHGIWLLVNRECSHRLSVTPLWFLPALGWLLISVLYITPVPWLGWHELIYALQAFVVLWVLCNNVETRAHFWVLLVISFFPVLLAVFNGCFQFFQDPGRITGAFTDFRLVLPERYLGQATGVFADPFTLAAFLLTFLPLLLTAAAVRRLPKILRILCFYIALVVMATVAFTQVYWAGLLLVFLVGVVPWFCYRRLRQRLLLSALGVVAVGAAMVFTVSFHPLFERGLVRALAEDGEGLRLVLWGEAVAMAAEHPLQGVGAGAYGVAFEQSPRVSLAKTPESPHNDYLLILSQLGVVGIILFGLPVLFIVWKAWKVWRQEPFGIKLQNEGGVIMPPRRFFLTLGLTGFLGFTLCMATTFILYVPAMLLYGVLLLSILVKASFPKKPSLGRRLPLRMAYCVLAFAAGFTVYEIAHDRLESHSLELRATQELDQLIAMRVHLSGNAQMLDSVLLRYEAALEADPKNVDAWLGLSSALCQLYFRSPVEFEAHGMRAVASARRATELSPQYWRGWAQLGVAHAYNAELEEAEANLLKALEMAPNSGQAHYFYAAFIGVNSTRQDEALRYVERALEINPEDGVARRLEQKLRIL